MNKIRAEKKKKLLMVLVITATVLAGIWFGLISSQRETLRTLDSHKASLQKEYEKMQTTLKTTARVQAELAEGIGGLSKLESSMASGDLYSWAINTIKQFKTSYKVEIPQYSQIAGPAEVNLLPNFPYQQASLTIAGTANFYDFGKFIADFENEFPFTRLTNLILEPATTTSAEDPEKLSFKVDIITLVKPRNS
jgi:Tfp pilus assembly protein PilO